MATCRGLDCVLQSFLFQFKGVHHWAPRLLVSLANSESPISGSLRELTRNQHDEFAEGKVGYVGPDPHIGGATKIFWS